MPWTLVTGATSGIGLAAARRLAAAGHDVIATGRNPDPASAPDAHWVTLDVTSADSVAACAARVDELTEGHGLDVLINNAGYSHIGPLELVGDEELRREFDTNVLGAMAVTRAFLPAMRRRGAGRIVNVGSPMGRMTLPLHGAYCASKAALRTLSDTLRQELAPFGVRVVLVEPGVVRSAFATTAVASAQATPAEGTPYAATVAGLPELYAKFYERAAEPEDVADSLLRAATDPHPAPNDIGFKQRVRVTALALLPARLGDELKRRVAGYAPG